MVDNRRVLLLGWGSMKARKKKELITSLESSNSSQARIPIRQEKRVTRSRAKGRKSSMVPGRGGRGVWD